MHAHVQRLGLVVKMATINKCFLYMVGSVYHVKQFTNWVTDVPLMKRLKRKCGSGWDNSQRLLCCGCRHVGGDRCINVGGYMSGNKCFFQVRISHVLCFISICVTYLLTVPRNNATVLWNNCMWALAEYGLEVEVYMVPPGTSIKHIPASHLLHQ
jgi:hypothetical protein